MHEPEWIFIDELKKPLHHRKPAYWAPRAPREDELSLAGGFALDWTFPDPNHLLDTARADFDMFCRVMELEQAAGAPVRLTVRKASTECPEAYRISVSPASVVLEAADTEGIRRGLVKLEFLLLAEGAPVLPLGQQAFHPYVKTRLSRCFFGPIKRPPMNRDELEDDVDYYPEEYLNRLAHEGVNALWLTVSFRDTVPITVLPGFGRRANVHLPKLRRTVEKCARYGIKIFVFFIEPTAFVDDPNHERHLDVNLYKDNWPELLGHRAYDMIGFCPESPLAGQFLYEAANSLFTQVPGLGGMIDISIGERFTHCYSVSAEDNNCPRCKNKKPAQVLARVLERLHRGMQDASPGALFISWPYSQYLVWGDEKTIDAAGRVPPGVVLQHNFESAGEVTQLGKTRRADDYWLSYAGPSRLFEACAARAAEKGTPMFAKLQVGCSHELASVTHVPVPGILHEKYRAMRRLGVSGAMQSWYFGNYPSPMTRAAGALSFEDFSGDKARFLTNLAAPDWGPHAPKVVQAWQLFQQAYENYPVYHVFGYYGPMHDGPVWPLYPEPVNRPLIPNWKFMPEFPVQGDRIGECLQDAFTLDEALILCRRMKTGWEDGVQVMLELLPVFEADPDRRREINTAVAIGILLASGTDILHFYQLREALADAEGERALECLGQMEAIVAAEIERGQRLITLCEDDPALGFNSEQEGYRFYPEKLRARMAALKELPDTFDTIRRRLSTGRPAFPAYTGQQPDRPCQTAALVKPAATPAGIDWAACNGGMALAPATPQWPAAAQDAPTFCAAENGHRLYLRVDAPGRIDAIHLTLFANRLWPARSYVLRRGESAAALIVDDTLRPPAIPFAIEAAWPGGTKGTEAAVLCIPFEDIERPKVLARRPLRLNVKAFVGPQNGGEAREYAWVARPPLPQRLAQSSQNPDEYGWLLLE